MGKSVLAADIGGTSSRFALFRATAEGLVKDKGVWLKTDDATSFGDLLNRLSAAGFETAMAEATIAVFAVAGPIEKGRRCTPPNISWKIDLDKEPVPLASSRAMLINDFLGQAYACCSPVVAGAETIVDGEPQHGSTIAVVGAGTGLGKAILCPFGTQYIGLPSEGAHATFPAESDDEFAFYQFVQDQLGVEYVVWDEIVSGRGLSLIHAFHTGKQLTPADAAREAFAAGPDSPTVEWFSRFYARVCRNFALETYSLGGVYIAGGVAAKNPGFLTHPTFRQTFVSSRAHGHLLQKIPVSLLDDEESGLWGAAYYGWQQIAVP